MTNSKLWQDDGWPAPCKVNRFLHITGRREDGYHMLQTIFQILDYGDTLYFDVREDGRIIRETEVEGVPPEDDLIVRAAKCLQTETHCALGCDVRVVKRIPQGGGLGGGSSDAATTLVALNERWGCGLSEDDLARIGLSLGADVPVFVRGHSAWAEGVGDILTPFELPQAWFLVIKPGCHVPTVKIFTDPGLTRNTPSMKIPAFHEDLGNDCEAVVRRLYEPVDQAMTWLSTYAKPRLTGTGACVFAVFDSEQAAQNVLDKLPEQWVGFVTKGVNTSALQIKKQGSQ